MTAVITCPLELDERMGWKTYQFRVDGHGFLGLTEDTGAPAARRLKAICDRHADELLAAVLAADKAREWNIRETNAGRQGKNWPAFNDLEKLRDKLCKEAGIKDT